MTNANIKTLAQIIAENGISEKTAKTVFKNLKKSEQKILASKLKLAIQKNKIIVTGTSKIDDTTQLSLKKIFGKSKIEILENENLGAGMIIQDNDTIYDTSFRGRLRNTLHQMSETL